MLHYRCALPGFVETPGHPARRLDEVLALEDFALHARGAHEAVLSSAWPGRGTAAPLATAAAVATAHLLNESAALGAAWEIGSVASGAWGLFEGPWKLSAARGRQLRGGGAAKGGGASAAEDCRRRALRGGGASSGGGAADPCAADQAAFDTERACKPELVERRRQLRGGGANGGGGGGGEALEHGECEAEQQCMYFDQNINFGLMGFDNIGKACLLILQAVTFDTWTDAMYALMDSFSPYVFVYFLLIALLGGIFVVQVMRGPPMMPPAQRPLCV